MRRPAAPACIAFTRLASGSTGMIFIAARQPAHERCLEVFGRADKEELAEGSEGQRGGDERSRRHRSGGSG